MCINKRLREFLQMSKESEEIKTIEQWKWSEMQGLELVSDDATPNSEPFKPNPPKLTTEEKEQGAGASASATQVQVPRETIMDTSEPNKEGGGASGEKKGAESVVPSVGFGELFRFADGLDYILMGIGTVGAIVHGCSLPLFLRFFADLVNSFGSNANNVDKMTQEVVKVTGHSSNSKLHAFCDGDFCFLFFSSKCELFRMLVFAVCILLPGGGCCYMGILMGR